MMYEMEVKGPKQSISGTEVLVQDTEERDAGVKNEEGRTGADR